METLNKEQAIGLVVESFEEFIATFIREREDDELEILAPKIDEALQRLYLTPDLVP